jgi:uncharacterized protein (TIGR02145 family)
MRTSFACTYRHRAFRLLRFRAGNTFAKRRAARRTKPKEFSALPGGNGSSGGKFFSGGGYNGDWWSTSENDGDGAYRFDLYYGDKAGWSDSEGSNRKFDKLKLFSIRCLKD